MSSYRMSFLLDSLVRQQAYTINSAISSVFEGRGPVKRYVIEIEGDVIATIPNETPHHEIVATAKTLQGEVKEYLFNVHYRIPHLTDDLPYGEVGWHKGELTTIIGMVKDSEIIMLFTDFIGNNRQGYDAIKSAAETLEARLEGIVVRAYYEDYP